MSSIWYDTDKLWPQKCDQAPQSVMWMHVEVHGHLSYELKACFTENIDVDGTVLCLKSVRQR